MELARGEPLSVRLRQGGLRTELVIALARQLAEGLDAIHQSGLVHRDIKPDNIVLELEPLSLRLVDFGFAAALDPRTLAKERAGTRAYIAPEQLSGARRVDARADLYSLGCVLFECMTGKRPLGQSPGGDVELNRAISTPGLVEVIQRLLAASPDDRYGSADELICALDSLTGSRGQAGRSSIAGNISRSVLIGREVELERLRAAWSDVRAGHGVMVRMTGQPGSGKTRLCAALCDELCQRGASLFFAACEDGEALPFSTVRQLLEAPLSSVSSLSGGAQMEAIGRLRKVVGDLAPLLAVVSPAFAKVLPDIGRLPRSDDAEHVMAEGLAEICARLLRGSLPAILVIDDFQWIDSGSRRVLAKLAERISRDSVLCVLAARAGVDQGTEPIARAYGDDVLDVVLGALSDAEFTAIVRAQLGGSRVDGELLEPMRALWDGSPLGAVELIRAMLESGVLEPHWGRWNLDPRALTEMELPRTCAQIIAHRIDALEPETRDVLSAGAVLGMRWDDQVLAPMCAVSEHAVQAALEDARRAQLVTAGARGTHHLVHGAVRDALLSRLSAERLRAMHQCAAEVMSADEDAAPTTAPATSAELVLAMMRNEHDEPGADDATRVARWFAIASHYAQGDPSVTPRRALSVTLRAARLAFRSFDNARALEYCAAVEAGAVALGNRLEPDVQFVIAEAHLRTGALERSLERFGRALEGTDEPILRAMIYGRMAWVQMQIDEDTAWQSLDLGFAALGVRPPTDSPTAVLTRVARWAATRTFARRPVESAEEIRRLEVLSDLYYQATRLSAQGARNLRLVECILRGLTNAEQVGNAEALVKSYLFYTFLLNNLGLKAAGRKYQIAAEAVARDSKDPVIYSQALQINHAIAAWTGDMADAIQSATTCLRDYGHWRELSEYCLLAYGLEQILSLQGRATEAWHWLSQAVNKVEGAVVALDFLEASARASLLALGRDDEVDAVLARMPVARLGMQRRPVFVGSLHGSRVRRFTEVMQLGDEFEAFVGEVRAEKLDPRRVHLATTEYYVHVAHARLHQCLRATPSERLRRLPEFEQTLEELRLAARVPLLRAHLAALRGHLEWMRSKWDAAERSFGEAEALGLRENAPWVLYTVHRGRAHMFLARGKADVARDQAALAEALAARHGAVHRVRWIREEFGKGIPLRADSSVTSSLSLLHGAMSSERSASHSMLRPRGYLRALQRITRASRVELEPAFQSRFVLDEIVKAMRADRGVLLVLREEGSETGRLCVAAARSGQHDLVDFAHDRALVDEALRTGEVAVSDKRAIVAPLLVRDACVGAVYLEREAGRSAFTGADAELFTALAAQVPVALELARILYERERAAETAHLTEKMGALGRFARGVSHDISNLFQQVLVTAEWLSEDADAKLGEQLGTIQESIRRAARLTERLNEFARSGAHFTPEVIGLEAEIEAMRPVLESVLGGSIELEIVAASGLWNVQMDAAHLDQVLLNLLSNARDAMPEGGRVTIELANTVLDEATLRDHPWLGRRECVELRVTDTGSGMDAETRSHVFEPYFTTKEVGRGTGLGLATVYGAIRQNGGQIEVESEPGVGTTVRIRLPRTTAAAAVAPKQRELPKRVSGTRKAVKCSTLPESEAPMRRILVVDDEDEVREALCRMLSVKGYGFFAASGAGEALELFRSFASEIDAVVTDLVMPGMDGLELARELEKVRAVPTIVVSGASDEVLAVHGLIGAKHFLAKPVFPNELDAKLREAIGAHESARGVG